MHTNALSSIWVGKRPYVESLGKILVGVGIVIAVIGGLLMIFPRIPWLGKLPGDIAIDRENFHLYFPLTTSIVLSLIVSLVLWLISQLKK